MYIDTHCHLNHQDYNNIDEIVQTNIKHHVETIIISSSTPEDIKETLELSELYSNIYASLGYHPESVDRVDESELKYLQSQLMHDKVVAIGEIGLDYHYTKENKEQQKELFRKQLALAQEYHLPVVIHSRDATEDTINILKEFQLTGIIHCFSGSLEIAKQYISMGYYLGIGGVITFKNNHLAEVVKEIPLEKIVLETDSPYLSPEPFRGKKNSSKNIPIIAQQIATIKEIPINEVETKTTITARQIFPKLIIKI